MMWPFAKRKRRASRSDWDLEQNLLDLAPGCPWTIRNSFEGTFSSGVSGSGKTTGSMNAILMAQLDAGYGGALFTSKAGDRANYERCIDRAGRRDDLLVFSPNDSMRYNFMASELAQTPDPVAAVENLTGLMMTVAELGDRSQSGSGGGGDNAAFFEKASRKACRNGMLPLVLSGESVSPQNLQRLILSSPRSLEELTSPSCRSASYCMRCLDAADKAPKSESQRADHELAVSFFCDEWLHLSPRTRTTIESTLTNTTDALSRGLVRDLLSSPSGNFSPSMLYDGGLVLMDVPVLVYRDVGRLIQVIFKYCLQLAHGRRNIHKNPRPTFMFSDECHLLAVAADQVFQSTARDSRTAVVNATQSISTYMDALGPQSEVKVHSLLGNLQTQIFHQQSDTRTISYIQELVGRSRQFMMNGNTQRDSDWMGTLFGTGSGGSSGFSEAYEFELQASDLNSLAKGGPPRWITEAIVYQGGRRFPNGKTWMPVAFRQKR